MKLTVEVTAQQLHPEGRPLLVVHWMDPDVARHKRGDKVVVFYPGVVQITVEHLGKNKEQTKSRGANVFFRLISNVAGSNWLPL